MKAYSNVFDELAVVDGLVLRGERIVVPRELRETIVTIAHEGHQGIVRTKQLLRAHVWFPGIDKMVKKHGGKWLAYQATIPCTTESHSKCQICQQAHGRKSVWISRGRFQIRTWL